MNDFNWTEKLPAILAIAVPASLLAVSRGTANLETLRCQLADGQSGLRISDGTYRTRAEGSHFGTLSDFPTRRSQPPLVSPVSDIDVDQQDPTRSVQCAAVR